MVKSLPALRETQVQSLGREDSPGEGNGNPFQYPCLEDSMDRGAWRAAVHEKQRLKHDSVMKTLSFCIQVKKGPVVLQAPE